MELRARIRPFTRPAALTAALSALLVPALAGPANADAATRKSTRYPVVTSVRPMQATLGQTIVIRGRYFNRGKNKNTVVFKRDGARAIFVKTTLGTAKQIRVVLPESLRATLAENTSARFRLRILSKGFSKKFTATSKSPTITAGPLPVKSGTGTTGATTTGGTTGPGSTTPAPVQQVCTGDEDHDMLDAALENSLGLDPCNPDTDGDGVPDGYEYQSARDLNDDEYQQVNQNLPYPGKRPYPNPLFADSGTDYDGDGLPMSAEYKLWDTYGARPAGGLLNDSYRLLYSDGEKYSLSTRTGGTGRRVPSQPAATYAKGAEFISWAQTHGYDPIMVVKSGVWYDTANQASYDIRDTNLNGVVDAGRPGVPGASSSPATGQYLFDETSIYDKDHDGYISDDERDEDADGLTNYDEYAGAMTPGYWKTYYQNEGAYPVAYAGTDLTVRDSDGDGIIDGADDQDHDDIPNVMELSRNMASGDVDWDAPYAGVISKAIPATLPDGPDPDNLPDPLTEWHRTDYGRVNPFNPCLPNTGSRTCSHFVDAGNSFSPWDRATDWFSLQ
jgi:hypothetical protein